MLDTDECVCVCVCLFDRVALLHREPLTLVLRSAVKVSYVEGE